MKTRCFVLVFLGCVLAGCGSRDNPYGLLWATATVSVTGYYATKDELMRHVYASTGTTLADFETIIEKTEGTKSVSPEFTPGPNPSTDHSLLFKYEGRNAVYYGRFVQQTHKQPEPLPTFSTDEMTNLTSFIAKLKSPADPVSVFLAGRFSEGSRLATAGLSESRMDEKPLEPVLLKELNTIILGPSIYEEDRFRGVALRPPTLRLLQLDLNPAPGMQISRQQITAVLNRMLLVDAYPSNLSMKRLIPMRNYVAIKY
jgi:hypothetical protein